MCVLKPPKGAIYCWWNVCVHVYVYARICVKSIFYARPGTTFSWNIQHLSEIITRPFVCVELRSKYTTYSIPITMSRIILEYIYRSIKIYQFRLRFHWTFSLSFNQQYSRIGSDNAWRLPGLKPLSEPMMARLPTHICVNKPQWINLVQLSGIAHSVIL